MTGTTDRQCLILDFDGTILDTEEPVYRSWVELWADHGHELELAQWQQIIGTAAGFDPWAALETRLGRRLDPSLDEARIQRRDELQALHLPRPGILMWLDEAARIGLPVGIASSSPADWVDGHLAELGILDRFGAVVCRNEEVPAKPDPTSYRLACEILGADPQRSVAVEDSPHGIAAAVAAGLYTVAVPHGLTEDLDLSAADLVAPGLDTVELTTALANARKREAGDNRYED